MPKFWERVVFVLTCSNNENCEKKDERDERDENVKEPHFSDTEIWNDLTGTRFKGRFQKRVTEMKEFLSKHVLSPVKQVSLRTYNLFLLDIILVQEVIRILIFFLALIIGCMTFLS